MINKIHIPTFLAAWMFLVFGLFTSTGFKNLTIPIISLFCAGGLFITVIVKMFKGKNDRK